MVWLAAWPALAVVPDGMITSKTKLSLWTTAGVRSTSVHVDTEDGVVTLYGKVPTADQKALAESTAREITGVREVKSLLQVVFQPQREPPRSLRVSVPAWSRCISRPDRGCRRR